jgi:hypothetical protein
MRLKDQVLVDYNGIGAKVRLPTPFKALDQPRFHVHSEDLGVDFGLIYLRQIYREGLQANNVVPFGPAQWFTRAGPVGGHYVVGFPEEFTETASWQGRIIGARVKPAMIPLHEVPDDSPHPFTRFKARVIDKGNQESVVGMSGGPIIAYYPDGDDAR